MKNLCLISFLVFGFTTLSHALLPPLYQSLNEYQSLLDDPTIGQLLSSGEYIVAIDRQEGGFKIITNKSEMDVKIIYEPQQMVGPARFHFEFSNPVPCQAPPIGG